MAQKVMKKNYNLVNAATGQTVTVFPPALPGADADGKNPKNDQGQWVRRWSVVDANGVPGFSVDQHIVTTNGAKTLPKADINGETWEIKAIEGLKATRTLKEAIEAATPVQAEDVAEDSTTQA